MEPIILFDGVCNFCNGMVNFIIARDPKAYFKFAPLQSETGQRMRLRFGVDESVDSIILIEDESAYVFSTAALRIVKALGGLWRLLYVFIIVPTPIRDLFYRLFARNRYWLFGKKSVCMVPTPDIRARFLD
ncbi:MAG TPA: thiol-disulfide oxidoreductase DCC family protein [Pyrinomonadaceae bacterium]|nr:thiol-disulfide oxidoreductase DCC family protein [Pyrinomonadaceae bacterium]